VEKYKINFEGKTISFVLHRKNVKNVNLKVKTDSTVVVSANNKVPYASIEQLIREKGPWVLKNIRHFDEVRRLKEIRKYTDGEIIYFLGRPYCLKVIPTDNGESIYLNQNEICLIVKEASDFYRKEKLFDRWFKEQARQIFYESLDRMHSEFISHHALEKPKIMIRNMKTRWGSCSWNKEKITLNTGLIKVSRDCIDYVVLHELTHFVFRKHDRQFYAFLALIMPDWKKRRNILRNCDTGSILV